MSNHWFADVWESSPGPELEAKALAHALGGRTCGSGWTARCPAHDDHNPSFRIDESPEGKLLFHCFAGCSQSDVISALNALGFWPVRSSSHRSPITSQLSKARCDGGLLAEQARAKAALILKSSRIADADHPYLVRKGINPNGALQYGAQLALPLRDAHGLLHSLQFISADGDKRFLKGGRTRGCYFAIGQPKRVICIAEGFATGATIHQATGHATAVAFNAGNLNSVGLALRKKFPEIELRFCADDDRHTQGNPGITKAIEAARCVGGTVTVPDFSEGAA